MLHDAAKEVIPKLSICITTFNRSALIGETLDSILIQTTDASEVVVLDGGSTDATEQVLSDYTSRFSRLRYIRQDMNNGFDHDCDLCVKAAKGDYCWMMTDDDLLKPGAVAAILDTLSHDVSLVVVNTEAWDFRMSRVLQSRWIDMESDRMYGPDEMDRLFTDVSVIIPYVGAVVVKRSLWLSRQREQYFGSWFGYLGVIFQSPLPGGAIVIATPWIRYRRGNDHTWSSRTFEMFMINLPSLVQSLPLSSLAKAKVGGAEPWRNTGELLLWRGMGTYSLLEYRQWIRPHLKTVQDKLAPAFIAILPGPLLNALLMLYFSLTRHRYRQAWPPELVLQLLRESRFYLPQWFALTRG
ncbi:glycosyltransferase family 2 protein [Steroidobacter agaridevorans]|uniref:glycosyltransferase family 2 protein n=1 Tax=Steroidobacter agaridevorans TaxID=2695856 RepID=UPI001329FFA7|nr:glycosyltransferase family 2 protein [Steroidobacter agaridevorans]GFE91918.1 hypothetical protein GCM10011488_68720 [Steroidobacter agaridevorans]